MCGTVRSELHVFNQIHHLPDPIPINLTLEKFKHFDECYGKTGKKEPDRYLPWKNQKAKEHGMPFSPIQQALKCTKMAVQCLDCLKWRCLYAAIKISQEEKRQPIEFFQYTRRSSLQEVEIDEDDTETLVLNKLYCSQKLTCSGPNGSSLLWCICQ